MRSSSPAWEPLGLAYLHVVAEAPTVTEKIRSSWSRTLIVNSAFSPEATTETVHGLLDDGGASTFYGGTDAGYVDYPTPDQAA
jgi:N-ethylmaleimide reductase